MTELPDIYAGRGKRAPGTDDAERKRAIYETMSPRGRRFVDRMGFEAWDPFQEPKDPLDIRTDATRRTTQQLVRKFLQSKRGAVDNAFSQGVLDCALGLVNKDEKFRGIFEFGLWYHELLRKEGYLDKP
jgi:hypothetical protein